MEQDHGLFQDTICILLQYSEYPASLPELLKINAEILFINIIQERNLFLHYLCLLPWKQLPHNSGVQYNNSFPRSWGDCLYTVDFSTLSLPMKWGFQLQCLAQSSLPRETYVPMLPSDTCSALHLSNHFLR